MTCSLSSKNSPRNTVDFEAACSVYIRFRGVNGYVKDVVLAKKIFAELADPAAKKAATRKVAARINAKRRQAIAKKYKLDEVTFFLIEAAGKSNGW